MRAPLRVALVVFVLAAMLVVVLALTGCRTNRAVVVCSGNAVVSKPRACG